MRTSSVLAVSAAALAAALAALTPLPAATAAHAAAPWPADGHPRAAEWSAHLRTPAHAAEVARIQRHFDSVLVELEARDVGALAPQARANRRALIGTLRAYRDRGAFPHNYDFAGQAVPYFVDQETGILCAVAHLLERTGRRDLVDRVAAADNNVWVPALAGDAEFAAWLHAHGLTLAEAARIQVPYVGDGPPEVTVVESRRSGPLSVGASVAGGTALAAALWNATGNAQGGSRLGNVLGFTSGVAAVGLGAAGLGDDGVSPALAAANVAVGAASVWLSTRAFRRHGHHQRVAAEQRANERREAPRASIAPVLPVGGESGAGLAVTVRF